MDASATNAALQPAVERYITLYPELRLALKCWGSPDSPKRILASHGWMDNASTWDEVAPTLAGEGWYVVAVDLPGHGKSDHKVPSCSYHAMDYASSLMDVADALSWRVFLVLGHSMSAGLMSVLAGSYPARVAGLVMVEGVGLSMRKAEEAVEHFVKGRQVHKAGNHRGGSGYPSIDAAVEARLATVARYGGEQYLSRQAAHRLVERALVEVKSNTASPQIEASSSPSGEGMPLRDPHGSVPSASAPSPSPSPSQWTFRHDKRIIGPSLVVPSEVHALAFLKAIRCPTLLVTATRGWPWPADVIASRLRVLQDALASPPGRITQSRVEDSEGRPEGREGEGDRHGAGADGRTQLVHVHLPGGHHLHLDPDTAGSVADAIKAFLTSAAVCSSWSTLEEAIDERSA